MKRRVWLAHSKQVNKVWAGPIAALNVTPVLGETRREETLWRHNKKTPVQVNVPVLEVERDSPIEREIWRREGE